MRRKSGSGGPGRFIASRLGATHFRTRKEERSYVENLLQKKAAELELRRNLRLRE